MSKLFTSERAEENFWRNFEMSLADNGEAASEHLNSGFPIYVQTDQTPEGLVEKRYPHGKVEFVIFDQHGEHLAVL